MDYTMSRVERITLLPPPDVIASWPPRNSVNPETRGPALYYLSIILPVIGVLVVVARIYSRTFITRAPGIDDIFILYATAAAVALSVFVIIGNTRYHSGYHIWDIDFTTAKDHRLNVWISQWMYLTSTGAIKISILLFYRRLSVSFTRAFRMATWVGIIYNIIQLVAFGLALLLVCLPVEAYWMSFDLPWAAENRGKFKCVNEGYGLTASAVFSVVGDLYAALLPTLLVSRLQLPRRQKFAVAALFAVGYIVVGMGIGRAVLIYRTSLGTYDFTWELWELWVWALLETWIGIYAASAPALKPFFKRFFIDKLSMVTGTGRSGSEAKKNTIGSGETKKPRSWNFLSCSEPKSPAKQVTEGTVMETISTITTHHEDKQDLERGPNALPLQSWHVTPGAPRDLGRVADYEAHCWSPASPPKPARTFSARSAGQPPRDKRPPGSGSQAHYRAASAASLQERIQSSERHISAQIKCLDVTQFNATPHSRGPSRASSKRGSPSQFEHSLRTRGSADIVGLAIGNEESASSLHPEPLRRNNTSGSDSSAKWLMAPARKGTMNPYERAISWSVLDEADEHSRRTSKRASIHGAPESSDSERDDSFTLPRQVPAPPR